MEQKDTFIDYEQWKQETSLMRRYLEEQRKKDIQSGLDYDLKTEKKKKDKDDLYFMRSKTFYGRCFNFCALYTKTGLNCTIFLLLIPTYILALPTALSITVTLAPIAVLITPPILLYVFIDRYLQDWD